MFKMLNAKYRGVTFDFEGERKSDLVECLAGIDYYLAREAAPHTPPEGDSTPDPKADVKEEAKTTRRRPAASKKAAANKTEDTGSEGEDDGDSTLDEKAAADTKAAEEKAAKDKAAAAKAKDKDEDKPEFTADDVKGRLQQYIEAFGAVQAKEMLGRYGVAKRSELDDKQTVEIMAEMEDRLEAGE